MRLLADECLDGRLVEGLRRAGRDVSAAGESARGAGDRSILERAANEQRTLVTEDKDFGDLIVRRGLRLPGIVLVRYSQRDIDAILHRLVAVVDRHGDGLRQLYVVITPERTRLRQLVVPRAPRS